MVTPTARREAVDLFRDRYGLSKRRACSLAGLARQPRATSLLKSLVIRGTNLGSRSLDQL